jgi:hypothetical protein
MPESMGLNFSGSIRFWNEEIHLIRGSFSD